MATALDILKADVAVRFAAHAPESWQIQAMQATREMCHALAQHIVETVPVGRDQAIALTHLEDVMFHANAGIVRPVPGVRV